MNYYEHHIGDYAAATAHLSLVEDAIYSRLLRRYYLEESPLPSDEAACARLAGARTQDERDAAAAVLAEFFPVSDADGLRHNKRADAEISAYRAKIAAAIANGKRGGRPRSKPCGSENETGAKAKKTQPFTSGSENETGTKALQTPDSIQEQELLPSAGAEAPTVSDPIWHTGLAFLRRKGLPESTARKFLGKLKREAGDIDAAALLAQADAEDITDPIPWLSAAAVQSRNQRSRGGNHATGTQGRNLSAVERVEQAIRDRRDAEARNAVSGCN